MGAFLTILLTLTPIAYCQATAPMTPEQERLTEMQRIASEMAQLPSVKADSIEQVVTFGVEENMLTVRTALRAEPGQKLNVKLPEMRGFLSFSLLGPQDDPQALGRNFGLEQRDLTDAQAGQVYTSISAVAGQLNLARNAENDRYSSSVQLTQDAPLPPGAVRSEDPIRLLVNHSDATGKENDLNLKLSAADFNQLRKKYPREVEKYLRPIFRDFKQEAALFGVKPQVAWQILGSDFAPDAALSQRVRALVAGLDADSFRERQAALAELRQIGQPAGMILSKMDRSKLSLQQSNAIESFLVDFAPLASDQTSGLIDDRGFLLDVLYNDDPALQKLALERLSKLAGTPVTLDPNAPSRADAIAKLREQLLPDGNDKLTK